MDTSEVLITNRGVEYPKVLNGVDQETGEIVDPAKIPLTEDEENFAIAYVEFGGNDRAAYQSVYGERSHAPLVNANRLKAKANVSARIRQLASSVQDHELVNKADHVFQLAQIRDFAMQQGALKVAKECEVARGQVMGWYAEKPKDNQEDRSVSVFVQIGGNAVPIDAHRSQVTIENGADA